MSKEKTAVDFLYEQICLPEYGTLPKWVEDARSEANKIFQKQLEQAHKDGQHYANHFEVPHQTQAEQYYESKYGKDETSRN